MQDKKTSTCHDQAIRYLSIREHNHRELERKLSDKGYSKEEISSTLERLDSEGFLSERRYIEAFIRSNNRKHPEGRVIVFQRLMQKEADKALSLEILDEVYSSEYSQNLAFELYEKLSRKYADEVIKAKMLKLGFRSSEIRIAMDGKKEM